MQAWGLWRVFLLGRCGRIELGAGCALLMDLNWVLLGLVFSGEDQKQGYGYYCLKGN